MLKRIFAVTNLLYSKNQHVVQNKVESYASILQKENLTRA